MNNINHTVTLPMKEYLELIKPTQQHEQSVSDLQQAFVELYDYAYRMSSCCPENTDTKTFRFNRDKTPGGIERVRFIRIPGK